MITSKPTDGGEGGVPIIEPDSAGRSGPLPVIESFETFDDEATRIANVFQKLHKERDQAWSEMCVLYCHNWMGKAIANAMTAADIPFTWLRDPNSKRNFSVSDESVKVITMHSSKGLEFPVVAACGIGSLGAKEETGGRRGQAFSM